MSKWNYRVVRSVEKIPPPHEYVDENYAVYEIHYNDKDEIIGCGKHPIAASGVCLKELVEDLVQIIMALALPVLKMEDLEKGDE